MTRLIAFLLAAVVLATGVAACGNSTPDVEGKNLADARKELDDAGVKASNITVQDPQGNPNPPGDPNELIVCDHDPDGVSPDEPTTLVVATQCTGNESAGGDPDDGSGGGKKKKRRK